MPSRMCVVDEDSPLPSAKTITEAAKLGNAREVLVALRSRVARAVEDELTPPRDLAALSKRLMDIVREIEAIDEREATAPASASAASAGNDDYEAFDPEAV